MGLEDDLLALIDVIYEAAIDSTLWPAALTKLADTMGAGQIGLCALDRRAHVYELIAPRTDPVLDARYKNYWAFHDPLWSLVSQRPVGEIHTFDSIMPRRDFCATSVFNEWYSQAKFGPAMIGANLLLGDQSLVLVCVANTPRNDHISDQQTLIFKDALRHLDRAVRVHRELAMRDFDQNTAPDKLENLRRSVILVDGAARVLFANAAARTLLASSSGLTLKSGCLHSTDDSDATQRLIASCSRKARAPNGPGGELSIQRGERRSPLRVTVTPLRAKGNVAELPWLGMGIPVAMVTAADPAMEKWMH